MRFFIIVLLLSLFAVSTFAGVAVITYLQGQLERQQAAITTALQ